MAKTAGFERPCVLSHNIAHTRIGTTKYEITALLNRIGKRAKEQEKKWGKARMSPRQWSRSKMSVQSHTQLPKGGQHDIVKAPEAHSLSCAHLSFLGFSGKRAWKRRAHTAPRSWSRALFTSIWDQSSLEKSCLLVQGICKMRLGVSDCTKMEEIYADIHVINN